MAIGQGHACTVKLPTHLISSTKEHFFVDSDCGLHGRMLLI